MNNVLFRRGDQTFIDENVPLNDGQIIFNETDEAIYVDTLINNVVTRKRYGGGNLSRSDIDMALSTVSENPVANKILTELMLQKDEIIDDFGTAMAVTENEVPVGCKVAQTLNNDNIATRQTIAPIETTLTASQPYAIGEQFIYQGLLYKATAAIAQGGTIIIDGNCELADSVTEQINGLNNGLIGFFDTAHITDFTDFNITSYVATINCWVRVYLASSSNSECLVSIDGFNVMTIVPATSQTIRWSVPVKAGQTIAVTGNNSKVQTVIPFL